LREDGEPQKAEQEAELSLSMHGIASAFTIFGSEGWAIFPLDSFEFRVLMPRTASFPI
jgi:hypothetical protein